MTTCVVLDGARTPIGKLLGVFSSLSAVDLGGIAIKAAVERSGVTADQIDAVVFGNVVQAGVGPNPARQCAAAAGLPINIPAVTINKLCLSGLVSVAMAVQMIKAGQHTVVVAGGTESMTNAPHLLQGSRQGYKYGEVKAADALDRDALICSFDKVSMGSSTEGYGNDHDISREELDAFAARSHQLAAAAIASGRLAEEIVPVEITTRKGTITVTDDEGVRADTTAEGLAKLKPAFAKDGRITAGNASQLSDGAAAVVVTTKEFAEAHGLSWIAEIRAHGEVAGPSPSLLLQPADAIKDALRRDGNATVADLDIVEINEAFASVGLASVKELGLNPDIVNVNGGAIAIGHPVGMSGARVLLSAAYELKKRGGGLGVVALCGGGGQGEAILFSTPA
jgi:acetyl-CoA C-acetyltransferase